MALGTKWYGTRAHRYEMTRNHQYEFDKYMLMCTIIIMKDHK